MNKSYLYISSVDISLSDGPAVNEREFILTLYKLIGNKVQFIIPEPEHKLPDSLPEQLFYFTYPHKLRTPWRWLFHQLSTYRAFNNCKEMIKPDILIFRTSLFAFAMSFITKTSNIPYVLKSEGLSTLTILDKKSKIWKLFSNIHYKLYKDLFANAMMVDTVNHDNVKEFEAMTGKSGNIVWIDNAVNTDRFKPMPIEQTRQKLNIKKINPLIGYVGNRPWNRGGMQIIEALPYLQKKHPNVGVVILGGGDGLSLLKQKAEELNEADRCRLTGQVPFDEVPDYVNAIDVGVSISSLQSRKVASELKVRQYLACGKPIVVSAGGSHFLAEKGLGSVVDPDNIEQIANELDKWISMSPEKRDRFSKKARNYAVSNLSFKSKVQKRLNMWSGLLEDNHLKSQNNVKV